MDYGPWVITMMVPADRPSAGTCRPPSSVWVSPRASCP